MRRPAKLLAFFLRPSANRLELSPVRELDRRQAAKSASRFMGFTSARSERNRPSLQALWDLRFLTQRRKNRTEGRGSRTKGLPA
jgi:hypothetical protein